MKEVDLDVLVSVFLEMLGPALWALVALAALGLAGFLAVVVRERGMSSRRLVRSELAGIVGGFTVIAFMQWITHSGFADIGGPIDWVLVASIWIVGAIGTTVLAYAALGLWRREDPQA